MPFISTLYTPSVGPDTGPDKPSRLKIFLIFLSPKGRGGEEQNADDVLVA
jgi:hypothetical protein